jgi:hypothetical protein
MQARTLTLALAALTGLAATIGGVAAANDGKPAPTTGGLALPGAPPHYEVRVRGPVQAPAGTVTRAVVKCKVKSPNQHILGGGAFVASTSLQVSIASDSPVADDITWGVSVVNASSTATSFSVYAVCDSDDVDGTGGGSGQPIAPHSLVTDQQPGNVCGSPATMDDLGMNVQGKGLQIVLHETRPTRTNGWTATLANNGDTTGTYALNNTCADIPGVHVISGPLVTNPPLSQTRASVMCDTGVPVAGRVGVSSSSGLVSVNSSIPITGGWQAFENNASASSESIRAWVMCSGS